MIQDDIEQLIEPVITDLGFELWGCEFQVQGKQALLRVYVDKDQGVMISDCGRLSRQINSILEVEDLIRGAYFLEVSSPGISRPLFRIEQYQRYIGKAVEIKLNKPINETRKLKGIISAIDSDIITLLVNDVEYKVPFLQIVKANLTGE